MSQPYEYLSPLRWYIAIIQATAGAASINVRLRNGDFYNLPLPASERAKAAQALAGDDYRVVPVDEVDVIQHDLARILTALGLGDHARPASPHQVVIREVLPAIERLKVAEPEAMRLHVGHHVHVPGLNSASEGGRVLAIRHEPDRFTIECLREEPFEPTDNSDPVTVDPGPHAHEWDEGQTCLVVGCDAVDPADVQVGDVVEVEADDGSWMVRGEVCSYDEPGTDYMLRVVVDHSDDRAVWPLTAGSTVRVLRPAPDPAEQERDALLRAYLDARSDVQDGYGTYTTADLVAELHARNVRVVEAGEQP